MLQQYPIAEAYTGPEVVGEAVRVLETINSVASDVELKLTEQPFAGRAVDALGEALPDSTLQACREADAILLGK